MKFIPGFKHFKYDLRKNLVIINYLLKDLLKDLLKELI